MKHLPKHLQPRWRYLAIGLESRPEATITRRSFQREVWYAGQNLLGDPGSGAADLRVVSFTWNDGRGQALLRVRRGETQPARAAVACVDTIDGEQVGLWVRGISGTIRGATETFLAEELY